MTATEALELAHLTVDSQKGRRLREKVLDGANRATSDAKLSKGPKDNKEKSLNGANPGYV